jgi:hypothetical protein
MISTIFRRICTQKIVNIVRQQTNILIHIYNRIGQNPYLSDLAGLSVARAFHLVGTPFRKANAKEAQHVVVSGLDINMGFNEGLPLLYQRPQLIGREIHALTIEWTS